MVITDNIKKLRLGILGSGNGGDLPAIVESINNGGLKGLAEIAVVISDFNDSGILQKANDYKLYSVCINPGDYRYNDKISKKLFDSSISNWLSGYKVDLITLIGYKRILSKMFVDEWKNKVINVHPSLLPDYAGLNDLGVHKQVLEDKSDVSGCTIHFVDNGIDTGPIILQASVLVEKDDTPETLKARV